MGNTQHCANTTNASSTSPCKGKRKPIFSRSINNYHPYPPHPTDT
jgi:hypothetical protein